MIITVLTILALLLAIAVEIIMLDRLFPRPVPSPVNEEPVEMQEIEPMQSVLNSINDFFLDKEA